MDERLNEWRKSHKHLPDFLQDFHDQKDFFRFLQEFSQSQEHEMLKDINWMQHQAYTLDVLLWCLARFGWTLQKSKSKQDFDNLQDFLRDFKKRKDIEFFNFLKETKGDEDGK